MGNAEKFFKVRCQRSRSRVFRFLCLSVFRCLF